MRRRIEIDKEAQDHYMGIKVAIERKMTNLRKEVTTLKQRHGTVEPEIVRVIENQAASLRARLGKVIGYLETIDKGGKVPIWKQKELDL